MTDNEILEGHLSSFQQIENFMGIEPVPAKQEVLPATIPTSNVEHSNADDLKKEALATQRRMIEKAEGLLDDLSEIARASEYARNFEVANQLIKTITETTALMTRGLEKEPTTEANNNTNNIQNNVFVGSSEDLMKIIRGDV